MGIIQENQRLSGVRGWLRAAAKGYLAKTPEESQDVSGQTPEEIIHELEVHQIELEIQNEELKEALQELRQSLD
ncbi:MAG: hypothetical protein V1862_11550 [Methanobacteriota archaeon]